jgi:hypothetical protein
MAPEDIRWEGDDPGISRGWPRHMIKKSMSHGGFNSSSVRRRASTNDQSKREFLLTQNGIARKLSDNIELLNTESLVKEVREIAWNLLHLLCVNINLFIFH